MFFLSGEEQTPGCRGSSATPAESPASLGDGAQHAGQSVQRPAGHGRAGGAPGPGPEEDGRDLLLPPGGDQRSQAGPPHVQTGAHPGGSEAGADPGGDAGRDAGRQVRGGLHRQRGLLGGAGGRGDPAHSVGA